MNDYAWLLYLGIFLCALLIITYFVIRPKRILQMYDSGEIRKVYFLKNGAKVNTETIFYRSGKRNKLKEYKDGQLSGLVVTLYESGAKYIEANYENGSLVGDYKIFEEDGSIKEIKKY